MAKYAGWCGLAGLSMQSMADADRRSFEARLRQAQKMDALERLAGALAHALNNSLTAILGNTELIQAELCREMPDDDPVVVALSQIQRAGQQAATLMRQLQTFSGRESAEPEPIDLNAILRDMTPLLWRLLSEDIALELLLAPDVRNIRADPHALEQLVTNLVLNARDAMPNGGRLIVKTENALLGEEYVARYPKARRGWHVILTVMDTGSGMAPDTIERAFEPFFTTKTADGAAGLGLATVHGIVRQSQGHIRVESELGRGTTFRIHCPACAPSPPRPESR